MRLSVRHRNNRKDTVIFMEPLTSNHDSKLSWVQPKTFERQFELRAGGKLFGTLRLEKALGTLATAHAATGTWTFKRSGFLNPRVTVREAGGETDAAVFWPRVWGGGWLDYPTGKRFQWKSMNFWGSAWAFTGMQGETVFTMRPGSEESRLSDLLKNQALVDVDAHAYDLTELPLLLMLGWYLMIMQHEESTAGAVAAIS